MNWEDMTAAEFARAVQNTGVCVLAMGVLEKHGEHLPLGTDFLNGHTLATLAAEIEEAVVFPPFYFGQIFEAMCYPGTVALKPTLLFDVLQGVLDEIGRNGFRKIIILSAHGGNKFLVNYLAQCSLAEEKPYALYVYQGLSKKQQEKWQKVCETSVHGHACECETSISLANHAHLVKMENIPAEPTLPLNRTKHLDAGFTGIHFYSNYPNHYVGDAKVATVEKGIALRQLQVDSLAEFIGAVKEDEVVPDLNREFFSRVTDVKNLKA
ncbi:MAG: creatininase family protein [Firmicutes bacterium]|nr:creatininase family protein [Bacillota bacterium]